jgi:hypothetical protein
MTQRGPKSWLQGVLLATPLVCFTIWIVAGAVAGSHAPSVGGATSPAEAPSLLPGFPPPEADLSADRLEDRVDGAAEYLRQHGCRRLVAWRLSDPPADLELLVFADPEGAAAVLARDAGPDRTAGPGDEASVADQSILFRRGPVYARLIGDPAAPAGGSQSTLPALAARVDEALRSPNVGLLAPAARGADR